MQHPGALPEVRRLEADSKFFRSAVVLFLIVLAILLVAVLWTLVCMLQDFMLHDFVQQEEVYGLASDVASAVLTFVFLRLSFARYCEQRTKAIDLAYQLLITSVALKGGSASGGLVGEVKA